MRLKKIILSANEKFEAKFKHLNKISSNILVFGQLFILLILAASLYYAVRIISEPRGFIEIFESLQTLLANAASGLCVLWFAAIFMDYIDKKNKQE